MEKLRSEIVKQASELHQKKAEVLNLIQEAKAENEKVTARKNLFTTTLAAKPPRRSSLQDVEPKKYKSPAQRLGFEWASSPQRTDKNGDTVLCTPVLNTAAALDVLYNDAYTKDEKIYYAATLARKALEQQAKADSYVDQVDARGGKLESKSNACKGATNGGPEDPSGSSSHGGKDKDKAKEPRKSPPPRRRDDEGSRTGRNPEDLPPPPPRRNDGGGREITICQGVAEIVLTPHRQEDTETAHALRHLRLGGRRRALVGTSPATPGSAE